MPVGQPSIAQLRNLELREVQARIEQIRARIAALDAEVQRLGKVADATSLAGQVQGLSSTVVSLQQRVSNLELQLGVTDTVDLTAAEAVDQLAVVVPAGPGQCRTADPNDPTQVHAAIGIALNSGAGGVAITIQRSGPLTLTGSSFDVGRPVYAGPNGQVTQDPGYGSFVIPIGVATSGSTIWISPELALLRSLGLYTSDHYDEATPVAWGLISRYVLALRALFEQQNGYVVLVDGELVSTGHVSGLAPLPPA